MLGYLKISIGFEKLQYTDTAILNEKIHLLHIVYCWIFINSQWDDINKGKLKKNK